MLTTFSQDAQQVASYCQAKLNLTDIKLRDEYGYASLPLCIIDAIFSIGVTYTSTRNTVKRFDAYFNLPEPMSIQDFIDLYHQYSIEFMVSNIYKNSQRTSTKNGILKAEAVLQVAEILKLHNINNLDDAVNIIGNEEFEADFKKIPGQSSGVSLNYFYMLIGSEKHIKPDRMIVRFLSECLGRDVKVEECQKLVVRASEYLEEKYPSITPRKLDQAIWKYQREQ